MDVEQFTNFVGGEGTFGLFTFWAIINHAAINIYIHVFVCTNAFILSLGQTPRKTLAS
jgi:hypothetical protein